MNHDSILIGTEVGEQSMEYSELGLVNLVALPGCGGFLADRFYDQAEIIEQQVQEEVGAEINEDIALTWDNNQSTASYWADTSEADELERLAAVTEDAVERRSLLQQVRQIRAGGRAQERLLARDTGRENARTRAFSKLYRKDIQAERADRLKKAHNLRLAADVLLQGIPVQQPVVASAWALERHACVFGGTGFGKSRLIRHLLTDQIRAGCSVIVIDPKPSAVEDMVSCAVEAGLSPEDVILLTPRDVHSSIPGWNPFLGKDAADIAARITKEILMILGEGWGPRMVAILTNVLNVMAAHRLSLAECSDFLTMDRYREALLETLPKEDSKSYRQSVRFFRNDFSTWPISGRDESVRAVTTRLNDVLQIPFISALLCSNRNTLDLGDFWRKQKMLIAHLDLSTLLPEGARIISTLIAYMTFLTAMKAKSTMGVPVVLVLDELGMQEKFLGEALSDMITYSRSQGLRLMVATQHFTKVSPPLLDALLGNACLQVFFQLSEKDARTISGSMAAATIQRIEKDAVPICVELGIEAAMQVWELPLCDPVGNTLQPTSREYLLSKVVLPEPDYSRLQPCPSLPELKTPTFPTITNRLVLPIIPRDLQKIIDQIRKWEQLEREINDANTKELDRARDLHLSHVVSRTASLEKTVGGSGGATYTFTAKYRTKIVSPSLSDIP
ncbi:helicase HerA domain-containing protein [Armatimonas sp.]|uniref:type IV secretory system conjugative DNA transfer family protein n=1 Tax=Armatimonas sp. TaxID=1872638 RepID=UPI0037539299